jgi:ATP-binding cassette subfamily B protein
LEYPVEEDSTALNQEVFQFNQDIVFHNVCFTYPGAAKPALQNISFSIPKGSIVGITGKTGSGKSTLAQLLTAQNKPDSGEILIDDTPPQAFSRSEFNRHIAYVPQDVFLFSDTLAGNIAFGLAEGEETDEKIRTAAQMAGLSRDIAQLPMGMDTLLGERGVLLSGGQKQRVSIARALIKDAEIYIFDDCLSAVDADTEKEILGSLTQRLQGKTAIIISHRLASFQSADHILLLDNGLISESGTFKELVNAGGTFASLYKLQNTSA